MASAIQNSPFNTFGLAQPLPSFDKLKGERERLPVTRQMGELKNAFLKNDVLVVSSGTGSGKTTQIPQYVAYLARTLNIPGHIACTQPRRMAAVKVAERVAQEVGCELGAQVGCQVRGDDSTSEETRLIYMTDGLMIARAFNDQKFSGYHTVIIDEAHECNANIYLLLGLIRRAGQIRSQKKGGGLKIIIMSATISVDKFVDYFKDKAKVRAIHMPGVTHEVDTRYLGETPRPTSSSSSNPDGPLSEPNISDIVEEACRTVAGIVQSKMRAGTILVFMPGVVEVEKVCRRIESKVEGVDAISLYSAQSAHAQEAVFKPATGRRKCIVSTNIAETSITIPDVVYVIDAGLEKVRRWLPRLGAFELRLRPTSKSSAMQRAGRCGRTGPGVCFRLYTYKDFDEDLRDEPDFEIIRDDVTPVFLKALAFGFTAATLPFIDLPPTENLLYATDLLNDLGYIDNQLRITNAGKRAAQAPFDPNWVYAINMAKAMHPHLAQHIVTIAALRSSMHSIFVTPPEPFAALAHKALTEFADPSSDLFTELNALYAFEDMEPTIPDDDELDRWCFFRFLNRRAIENALLVRNMAFETMSIDDKPRNFHGQDRRIVRKILARAFFRHIAYSAPPLEKEEDYARYRTIHGNLQVLLAQDSALNTGPHPWVMYDELKMGSNLCMQKATAIEPEWIVDLPYFQDDRLKRDWNGCIVQTRVKEELEKVRASMA